MNPGYPWIRRIPVLLLVLQAPVLHGGYLAAGAAGGAAAVSVEDKLDDDED